MSFASFHVFLSHNSADKPAVEELARRLKAEGIEAWFDKWHLVPGKPWQPALEQALADSLSVAVFVGPSGFGPWQDEEMRAAIAKRVRQKDAEFRVIPVLLPGGTREERSRLPEFLLASTWVEFRNSLDEDDAYHRLKSGVLGVAPGLSPGEAIYEGQCPYRGLQAFQPEHAAFFFGREARIEWLLNALRPAQSFDRSGTPRENRFLAIVGASGSGKSSLARAGLVPALRNGKLEGSANWPILICRPGHDPLESLAVALVGDPQIGSRVGDVGNLITQMASDETRLHLAVRVALAGAEETQRVVILIDQFEEIFTLYSDDSAKSRSSRSFANFSQINATEDHRKAFVDNLIYAAGIPGGKVIVVLTMRADFYGKCALHHHLAAAITDHQELVAPMSSEELREVIERPAQLCGLELERGLTEMLLNEMDDQAGALPLLQHALWELWQRREGRRLTISAYQTIGGLEGALEQQANSIFDLMNKSEQDTCRRIFLRLTQPGEGSEDTKRRVPMNQLGDPKMISSVINRLTNVRLITTEKDSFVEVSHEALIRSWTKLRSWIEGDREALRTQHRLTEAAAEWIGSSQNDNYLYQGARLAEAEEWSNTPEADLTRDERMFLAASLEQRDRSKREEAERQVREVETLKKLAESETQRASEQARAAQRSKWQSLAALALTGVALVAFVWAAKAQHTAEGNARQTEIARQEIEETLASNLLERTHILPGPVGPNEYDSFWQIASLPTEDEMQQKQVSETLRKRVLRRAFATDEDAMRLVNRAPYVSRALVGLDEARRRIIRDEFILPILKNPSATSMQRFASARIGLALNMDGIEFAEFAIRTLSDELTRNRYPELIHQLSADLNMAIHLVPESEAQRAVDPIISAIQQTSDPQILQKLCDGIGELPGKMTPEDVLRVANRLLHVMESEQRPDLIRELSRSLVSLPKHLNVINASRGIKYIVHAIENTKRTEVRRSLVETIKSWSQKLGPDDFKVTEEEILLALKRAPDSETMGVFAQCLTIVAVHHSHLDIRQATTVLLEAMSLIDESDPLYELCKGLSQLSGKISENDGRTAISRILKVMAKEGSSKYLGLLAKSLCTIPVPMTDEENAEATKRLLTCIGNSETLPLELLNLTNGLSTLPNPLSLPDSQQLFDSLFRSLDRFQKAVLIQKIQESMQLAGRKLTAPAADAIAEEILKRMESYQDTEKIRALAYGLRGIENVVNSTQIKRAYELVRDKIHNPALNQPLELSYLAETLSIIPEDIPESIAEDAIDRMLAILVSIENAEIVQLVVDKLGFVGGDISKRAGHQAVRQILDRIKSTKESSLLQALSLGLASVSISLKDFTENDSAEVAKYLAMAMDATSNPDVLIRLGQALEKIAPKLPKQGDQDIVRRVVEQNLRSIQATQSPKVIGQLARIWQVMARQMTEKETQDAFEQILASNGAVANVAARPALCQAAVALAIASDKSQANYALKYLLSALHNDHDPDVLKTMLDGVEELAQRVPVDDLKQTKAAIIAITADHDRANDNEEVLTRLITTLEKLPVSIDLSESIELLKSPFCIGKTQQSLLKIIEAQKGSSFDGNPWKLVASAKELGIDPKTLNQPAIRPSKLNLNLPREETNSLNHESDESHK